MKFNKYIYILMAGVMGITSCKKEFLDEKPPTAVPVADAIKTENDMSDAVNGMYASMRTSNTFGRDIPALGDILSDNVYVSSSNSGRYLQENNYSYINNNAEAADIFNQSYYTILQANRIINTSIASSSAVGQYKGEAYIVRALNYLQLVNFFATPYTVNPAAPGVALVTGYTGPNIKPSRNTVTEVYAKIISDLDSAYAIMPATSTHGNSSYYLSKYAAKAIEARAYLYKGDYAGARDAALLVVQGGGYTQATATGLSAYWANNVGSTNKVETIFEMALNTATNNGTNGLDYEYDQPVGYGDFLATTDLYNQYRATDARRAFITAGVRKGNGLPALIVSKYPNVSQSDRDDIKIIRYSEVLLTLAEGYARSADEVNALKYLNQFVAQRDPSLVYASTGTQLINDILNERRKEFAFEGLRFFDLTRTNQVINRPQMANSAPSYPTVSLTDFRRILPIPQAEMDANPNMKQNPGY
ncbi:RagB/SusD family nutrient uptake outer membrane protein [Mucilaginibacter agri]|uniref:RagB/SusD family nutrient uptake outer membrane protein n=1 Tax=Mucilaginibacter agri TaxID=2695265 RepID=A0A965ZGU5_9SPHI|nr:RagB/SusD family nutrient uptake outer membrane protein [Mucilaginibacter agri]NCD69512.1 RagB/SusD family nutrient uptake outer membrane protein [Mucilaginibacter agri]